MRGSASFVWATALTVVLAGGCRESPPAGAAAGVGEAAPVPVGAAPFAVLGGAAGAEPPACIRGGTPREDVRRILGEPDSISFGAWLYGSSEIQFGYGVVVETRDPEARLHLCD